VSIYFLWDAFLERQRFFSFFFFVGLAIFKFSFKILCKEGL